jgi:hypothetical protein
VKCIKCNTDNKLKERTANAGKCKSCKHKISFDPKAQGTVNFTDRFFANTISAISVNDTLFFTPGQFYYFFNSRREKTQDPLIGTGCAVLVIGIVLFIAAISSGSPIVFLLALAALAAGVLLLIPRVRKRIRAMNDDPRHGSKQPKEITVSQNQLDGWLERWMHNNGRVAKLLPKPEMKSKHVDISPEIKQYSFDRLIVCEHAAIAQFLIANNFHFENNCAVLSIDKYPHNIFDTVMEMLRLNPALKVYALHDASPAGIQLTHRLAADPDWFKASTNVQIHDLGLLPRQILDKSVFVRESAKFANQPGTALAGPAGASLRPDETTWLLEGKYVEMESISPKVLLRVVTQGIARSRAPGVDDALVPVSDSTYGRDVYFFAYDSFG